MDVNIAVLIFLKNGDRFVRESSSSPAYHGSGWNHVQLRSVGICEKCACTHKVVLYTFIQVTSFPVDLHDKLVRVNTISKLSTVLDRLHSKDTSGEDWKSDGR